MKTANCILILAATIIALAPLTACSSVGPATVTRDRVDYGNSIGDSWKEQTLLNIVRLRYGDVPTFLEVTQVVAGYQLQGTIGGSFSAGNASGSTVGPFAAQGSALASGTYTDRPTIIYAPLTGVDFIKHLMTPVPPSDVLFLLQAGYSAALVMPVILDSINGLKNASLRLNRPADPKFQRVVEIVYQAQLAGAIQIRIERGKEGGETSLIAFGTRGNAETDAQAREIRQLLGLKPDVQELKVFYGGYSGKNDEIDMQTRSMLQILLEFAAAVRVPEADVAERRASAGMTDAAAADSIGPSLNIGVSDAAPKDAYVAIHYGRRWFWIPDTDIRSKNVFAALMLLFSISETGVKGSAPVVTVPASP
jgi:hypothetical protein